MLRYPAVTSRPRCHSVPTSLAGAAAWAVRPVVVKPPHVVSFSPASAGGQTCMEALLSTIVDAIE